MHAPTHLLGLRVDRVLAMKPATREDLRRHERAGHSREIVIASPIALAVMLALDAGLSLGAGIFRIEQSKT